MPGPLTDRELRWLQRNESNLRKFKIRVTTSEGESFLEPLDPVLFYSYYQSLNPSWSQYPDMEAKRSVCEDTIAWASLALRVIGGNQRCARDRIFYLGHLGEALAFLGEKQEALSVYSWAIEIVEQASSSQFERHWVESDDVRNSIFLKCAELHVELGDLDAARDLYRKATALVRGSAPHSLHWLAVREQVLAGLLAKTALAAWLCCDSIELQRSVDAARKTASLVHPVVEKPMNEERIVNSIRVAVTSLFARIAFENNSIALLRTAVMIALTGKEAARAHFNAVAERCTRQEDRTPGHRIVFAIASALRVSELDVRSDDPSAIDEIRAAIRAIDQIDGPRFEEIEEINVCLHWLFCAVSLGRTTSLDERVKLLLRMIKAYSGAGGPTVDLLIRFNASLRWALSNEYMDLLPAAVTDNDERALPDDHTLVRFARSLDESPVMSEEIQAKHVDSAWQWCLSAMSIFSHDDAQALVKACIWVAAGGIQARKAVDGGGSVALWEDALACIDSAVKSGCGHLDEDRVELNYRIARRWQAWERYEEALERYELAREVAESISSDVRYGGLTGIYLSMASTLCDLKRLGDAVMCFEKASARLGESYDTGCFHYFRVLHKLCHLLKDEEPSRALALSERALAQLRKERFPEVAGLADQICDLVCDLDGWDRIFQGISVIFRALADDLQRDTLQYQTHYLVFHKRFLRECVRHHRYDLMPDLLAAIQGRRLLAFMAADLALADSEAERSLLTHALEMQRVLRRLALALGADIGDLLREHLNSMFWFSTSVWGLDEWEPGLARNGIPKDRQELLLCYLNHVKHFSSVRHELAKYEKGRAFVSVPPAPPGLASLVSNLSSGVAVLILLDFEKSTGEDSRGVIGVLFCAASKGPAYVAFPGLKQVAGRIRQYEASKSHTRCLRYSSSSKPAQVSATDAATATNNSDQIASDLAECFWKPLEAAIGGMVHLHLVTHGELHVLPLELGAPARMRLSVYPGLLFVKPPEHPIASIDQMATDIVLTGAFVAAQDNSVFPPIPFAAAEISLVAQVWQAHVPVGSYSWSSQQPNKRIFYLHLAGHGDHDQLIPSEASLLLAEDERISIDDVLSGHVRPQLVFLSACVTGRINEEFGGDPLGLVSAFLAVGARHVIAPTVPVSDFFMPILSTLFNQGLVRQRLNEGACDPAAALLDAKERLATGSWFENGISGPSTEDLLRDAYRPAIADHFQAILARPDASSELLKTIDGWLPSLPTDIRDTIVFDLDTPAVMASMLTDWLFEQRHSLVRLDAVKDLICFVRCWGGCQG